MPTIDLTDDEVALLLDILHESYTDLRYEIYDTDTSSFKERLRAHRDVLEGILAKLGSHPGPPR